MIEHIDRSPEFAKQPISARLRDAAAANEAMRNLSATARVEHALTALPGQHVVSSSFGAQAAVTLHLATTVRPDLPVVLVDTGYLFPETYQFVETLTERLDLNLQVYRPLRSAAQQEALEGQRWLDGIEGLEAYNQENKVEPMQRALRELEAGTWITGLRRSQAESRAETPYVAFTGDRFKVAPIADWSDRDVHRYLTHHNLPYHPLWHEGYLSIGDVHTTRSIHEVDSADELRFFGWKRECGLHE